MAPPLIKGLQRKRGYFNLEGDTERQMQDFEQDTDDSLRALSDQIDRVRTEAVESKEETQTEVTLVSEETSGQNAQIGDLDDRVTALENPPLTPHAHMRPVDEADILDDGYMNFSIVTTRGNISVGADAITINEDGIYQVDQIGSWSTASAAAPSIISFDCMAGGVTVARPGGTRFNTNTGNVIPIQFGFSWYLEAGDTIQFQNVSGSTISPIASASSNRITVTKVGE